MKVPTIDILGVPFSCMTMEATIAYLADRLGAYTESAFHVVTANPEIVMHARKDPVFQQTLRRADLITPDGIGVVKASGILGTPLKERVGGFDLMCGLFDTLSSQGGQVRVFLLGAKPHVVERAANYLSSRYSAVRVVGYHDGYFKADDEENIIEMIQDVNPDLLLVALGFPRQEQFIQTYKHRLRAKVAVGVGGSFDVWAGEVKRAPKWMQMVHLEWFYRLLQTPSRWRRQLVLVEFVRIVLQEKRIAR